MNLLKEVKYLGVILDDILMWKAHVKAQVKKGLRALWSRSVFIDRAWRLSPKMTLWLYKRVTIHKITYAAIACWDILDIAFARSELEHLQRVTCTMIIGPMKTTPTKVLEMHLDLPTLGTMMESVTLMAVYHLPRPDPRNLGIDIIGSGQKQIKWTVSSI